MAARAEGTRMVVASQMSFSHLVRMECLAPRGLRARLESRVVMVYLVQLEKPEQPEEMV